MKRFYLIAAFALSSLLSNGQSFVEIGAGTVSTSYPVYGAWAYGWFSAIYPAQGSIGANAITHIALNCINGTKTANNQKIYLKLSTDNVFAGTNYENPESNGYTLVYSGSISFNGWTVIDITDFTYDGTSNIIVHWENRNGDFSYQYPNFNSTTSSTNNNKGNGSDTPFPTVNGYLNPYPSSLPNIRFYYEAGAAPETPQNELPASNSTKVNVDTELSIDLGENTTAFDVYFSTVEALVASMDESVRVVTNEEVSAAGTITITLPDTPLLSKTNYFWRVVAKNASDETASPVFSFQTQRVISALPYTQGFEDTEIWTPGWYGDLTKTDWYYQTTPVNWNKSSEANAYSGLASAICHPSGNGGDFELRTPRINLPANHYVSFWWRNNSVIVNKVEGSDATYVEVSTDGGVNWTELSVLAPATPNEWTWALIDLSDYVSSNVHLRWRYTRPDGQAGVPIFIDDIVIDEITDGGEISLSASSIEFPSLAVSGLMQKSVTLTNTGTGFLNVTNATVEAPYSCSFTANLAPGQSAEIVVEYNPTEVGASSKTLTLNIDGSYTGDNTIALSGSAVGLVANFFQPFDANLNIPAGWNALNNPNHQFTSVAIKADSYAYSAPNVAKFVMFSEHNYPVTLATPGLDNFDTHQLKFYAKKGGDYDMNIIVGRMANPYDVDSFVEVETFVLTDIHQQFTVNFEPMEGYPYVGIRHGGNPETSSVTSIWLDDVSWNTAVGSVPNPALISKPGNGATNVDIMVNLKFQWINGGGDPNGYHFYFGESASNFNIVNGLLFEGSNNTSYTYTGAISYGTTYFWKVVPFNTTGNAVDCPVWSFTTMADPTITSLPFVENFNSLVPGPGFNFPLGWTVENTNNDGPSWDVVANTVTPSMAHSAPNAMNIIFSFYDMNDWLITPPIALEASKSYSLSFWFRTMGDQIVPNPVEKLSVYLGTDNVSTAMSTTALHQNLTLNNLEWEQATVNFSPSADGAYYIGFHGHSDSFQGYMLLDDVVVDFNTSIIDPTQSSKALQLFPNPAKGFVNINLDNDSQLPYNVKVVSITGQVMIEKSMLNGLLQLDGLANGVYFVVAENSAGRYVGKLVVK
jgi:hypothetical protein